MKNNRTELNMGLQVGYHGDFYIESYEGKVSILSYEGQQEVVRIPNVIAGFPVVRIERLAFVREQSKNLVSIELPVNLTDIDGEAFPTDIKIERYFNREMEGFEHEFHWITDPYLDETGRFTVNPLDYYGLKVVDSHSIETGMQTTLKPQCKNEEYVNVERRSIQSPADVYSMFDYLKYEKQEQFVVAFLNHKNQKIGMTCVLKGNLSSSIHPREVLRLAVQKSASSIIAAQLQLSDNLSPSTEIIKFTNLLMECGELLGIELLDTIIVSEGKYISLREKNYI